MSNRGDPLGFPEAVLSLTETECRDLLRAGTFGRVGLTSGGLPAIVPVRYVYDDGAVTFGAVAGTKLRAAQSGDVLAFEIDAYDHDVGAGWSVLTVGRASVMSAPRDVGQYVRLFCEIITGRRFLRSESESVPQVGESHAAAPGLA